MWKIGKGVSPRRESYGGRRTIITIHSADALAVTDCTLWFLDEKSFHEALVKSPEFSLMILKGLAKRLTDMNEKMRDIFSHLRDFSDRLEDLSILWHTTIVP